MEDISAIEARLKAALDRIAEGVGNIPKAPTAEEIEHMKTEAANAARAEASLSSSDTEAALKSAESQVEALKAELEDEKAAHTKMSERVAALREKQEQSVDQLEKRVSQLQDQSNTQVKDLARLRHANDALRNTIKALREAAASGDLNGEAVNAALRAELDATRAQQNADRSELDAILAELTPLIQENADV